MTVADAARAREGYRERGRRLRALPWWIVAAVFLLALVLCGLPEVR